MASYTVIQDIEAEDKLLGPLTLRQFLYAVVVAILGFISFRLAVVNIFLGIPLLPVMILFGFLAAPFGHDQTSEVWLLAKIRFILKPRLRIWDQTGLQQLVTITVPKKIERQLTDGLSEHQVRSRLRALADTIDTRGWVVKGVNVNMNAGTAAYGVQSGDRLISLDSVMPQQVPDVDVSVNDDPMDAFNPVAQQMGQMVQSSEQAHRAQIMKEMQAIRNANAQAATAQASPRAVSQPPQATQPVRPVTPSPQPGIIELSKRDDFTVATIARQANKDNGPQDEVVISLR